MVRVWFGWVWLGGWFGVCVGNINKVKLRRTRLVLGFVTTCYGSMISVFLMSPRLTQPGHPSVSRWNNWWRWFFSRCWGRNGEFCVAVGHATRTGGILAEVD